MTDLKIFAPKTTLGRGKLSVTMEEVREISSKWESLAKTEKSERVKSRSWEKIKNRVVRKFYIQ